MLSEYLKRRAMETENISVSPIEEKIFSQELKNLRKNYRNILPEILPHDLYRLKKIIREARDANNFVSIYPADNTIFVRNRAGKNRGKFQLFTPDKLNQGTAPVNLRSSGFFAESEIKPKFPVYENTAHQINYNIEFRPTIEINKIPAVYLEDEKIHVGFYFSKKFKQYLPYILFDKYGHILEVFRKDLILNKNGRVIREKGNNEEYSLE